MRAWPDTGDRARYLVSGALDAQHLVLNTAGWRLDPARQVGHAAVTPHWGH